MHNVLTNSDYIKTEVTKSTTELKAAPTSMELNNFGNIIIILLTNYTVYSLNDILAEYM